MKEKLCAVIESDEKGKKYEAIFRDKECPCKASEKPECGRKETRVSFGAKGMSDYTINKDDERKNRYISRHKTNENWNNYKTAGFYAKNILWNKPTVEASVADTNRRFKNMHIKLK
jgi:hypothetical protein